MGAIDTTLGQYATVLNGFGWTRAPSDLSDTSEQDLHSIGAGLVKYQLRATFTGEQRTSDANAVYYTWAVELVVHHKLASAANERAWTEDPAGMLIAQQTLAARTFWKNGSTPFVYDVTDVDFTEPPSREGNVVSFAVQAIIWTTF